MSAFFLYARNITYYLLFAALVNLAAPGGKYRKMVRLITGFILLCLILQPLRTLLDGGGTPVTEIFAQIIPAPAASADENETASLASSYEAWRYESIKEAFETQLQAQLSSLLESEGGYVLREAAFTYEDDFSRITRITAEVGETGPTGQVGQKQTRTPFIHIETPKISVGDGGVAASESESVRAIKKLIADFYNMSTDNIYVIVTP